MKFGDLEIKSRIWKFSWRLPEKNWKPPTRCDRPPSNLDINQEWVNQNMSKAQDQEQEAPEEDTTDQPNKKVTSALKVLWASRKLNKWVALLLATAMKKKRDLCTKVRCPWDSLWRSSMEMIKKEMYIWHLSWSKSSKLLREKPKMESTTVTIPTIYTFITLMLNIWTDWLSNLVQISSTEITKMMEADHPFWHQHTRTIVWAVKTTTTMPPLVAHGSWEW